MRLKKFMGQQVSSGIVKAVNKTIKDVTMPLCSHCLCGYNVKDNVLKCQGGLTPIFGQRAIERDCTSLREGLHNKYKESKELSEGVQYENI